MISADDIAKRAARLTQTERRRLARRWAWQIGGGDAIAAVRRVAIASQRDAVLRSLREASADVARMSGPEQSGDRAAYETAQARQCAAETMLAVTVADLAGRGGSPSGTSRSCSRPGER